jgi:hypothetical protein
VTFVSRATLGRLIPAGAVAAVLAVSYFAQTPTLASNNEVGYGYANNCGVKGDGFHDHGKTCPNRPFPGQGEGLTIAVSNGNGSSETGTTKATSTETSGATTTTAGTSGSSDASTTAGSINHQSLGNGHGKGLARGLLNAMRHGAS